MTRAYLAFTEKGLALAQKLASALPGTVARCGHGGPGLADWAAEQFAHADALIFVGAVGIAVRAIAPHCRSKAVDPAVVVLDECGHFAVPILSGHLGGANDLARALAAVCGAVPVITTATDANGVFAVDAWARHQNCAVLEPERIKLVSGALLAGKTVQFASDWPIAGSPPAGLAEDAGWYVQLPGFGNVAVGHHPPGGGQGWQTAHYRHTQGAGKCVFQLRGTDKDRLQAFGLPVLHAGLLVSPQPAFAEGSSFFPHIGQLAGA